MDCHGAATKTLGIGHAPYSGLHFNGTAAANVTHHDASLGATGCRECHGVSTAATHANGTFDGGRGEPTESRFITRADLTFTDAAPNSPTCSGTGLAGCHTDAGNWTRRWSTAANFNYVASPNPSQAVCNVCHGQYATLANSAGWRPGTAHYMAGNDVNENKGIIHTDPAPDPGQDLRGRQHNN